MHQPLELFSENLLHMMRGALMMQFILMCINLYPRRGESTILNYLFWLLTIMSACLFVSFGYMFEELRENHYFCSIKILTDLCLVPLIGSFLLKILIPEYINCRKILLLLAPNVLFTILYTITQSSLVSALSFGYAALLSVLIFVFIVFVSIRYDRFLKNNFSNIDNKTVGWVRTVVYFFVWWYLAWVLILLTTDSRWVYSGYYLFLIILWAFIYRHSIKHVATVKAKELFETEPIATIQPIVDNKFTTQVEQYIVREQPWLNPSLTLQEMADSLDTNRTYLSEYFNKTLGTTFYDYLNDFRIKHACVLLLSRPNEKLLKIGEWSGFNSLSTFRRAFEKQTRMTPAEYRRQNIS